jgi:hypothetical protein
MNASTLSARSGRMTTLGKKASQMFKNKMKGKKGGHHGRNSGYNRGIGSALRHFEHMLSGIGRKFTYLHVQFIELKMRCGGSCLECIAVLLKEYHALLAQW